jgi:hypothetical protein
VPLFLRPTSSTIACHLWGFGMYFVCAAGLYLTKGGSPACVSGPIMAQPGYLERIRGGWPQSRRYERERQLAALLLPRIKDLMKTRGIKLIDYREVDHQSGAAAPLRGDRPNS